MSTIEFVNHIKDKKFDIKLRTPFTCISKVISEWIGESYSVTTIKRLLLFRRYFDSFPLARVLRDRQVRLVSLRELQSQTQEQLDALSSSLAKHPERAKRSGRKLPCAASGIPSVLDRAFKGEL
jgi:hypothetical protein